MLAMATAALSALSPYSTIKAAQCSQTTSNPAFTTSGYASDTPAFESLVSIGWSILQTVLSHLHLPA